ncbi:outer membrane protein assembly factor BamA [Candidatus Pelagibacter sp. RS39]|uniref:outer membrane protein assembly factor BamA n=1 Tax=Candidatus Pelagibacter sp. RS39 TaxID=1977864 RepID=UPI000A1585BC|nr:outer membrane protein assembly factor BamA [Candidatus Pelagibacter sp. RS39]ARJ47789.1 outer membrane protein assembly factor BamA [Candidatus Pelagibacter sp. RS39]
MNNLLVKIIVIFSFLLSLANAEALKKFEISGNKRISDQTIIIFSELKVNEEITKIKLDEVIKKLYKTSFFKDINLSFENQTLFLKVEENPIIEKLEITGIKKQSLVEFIKDKLQLAEMKSFDQNLLSSDINLIYNILKTNGYYFAKISSAKNVDETLNTLDLKIDVELGEKAKIKKIIFLGEKIFKEKRLKEAIVSQEHKFWKFISRNVYINEELINLDKRLLTNYFKNNGYFNVRIENSFVEFDKDSNFNLIFNITPGKKYFFNDFSLNLPPNYDAKLFENITKKFSKLKGDTYSLLKVNDLLDDINDIALSRQYEFINASINETINGDKIDFNINISESDKFYVEKINITGNFNTLEEVIRNKLIIDEGDPFNEILFNKSVNNIQSLGIFKKVKTDIKNGSNNSFKEIDINVEERPTGEISLTAGFGTTGETIGAGIKENNFLGKGIKLNTNFEVTSDSIKGQFIYAKPNFNYSDNTLFTSIKSSTSDFLTNSGYKTSEIGFSLGTKFEQFQNIFLSPEIDFLIEDLETTNDASNILKKQEGSYTDLYFNYSINQDLRDKKFRTEDGYVTTFSQELPLVSDNSELSNAFEITNYRKLSSTSDMVGKVSFYGKTITGLSDDVRISKRLTVPSYKLRGFQRGKIGPVDNNDYVGGNHVSSLNLSATLPTLVQGLDNLDVGVFFDAANVWGVDYDSSIDDKSTIRSSAGVALNLMTPIGPLSFSFADALSKASSDKTETFRFNLGTQF